jgi:PadR family transcriptional regulator, regulatory protein PadR
MGKLYRFVEPVLLYLLKKKGQAYGYELIGELNEHALTDSTIERGAVYRTLRTLEANGNVVSDWDVSGNGPARRQYRLTPAGEIHLEEWAEVLGNLSNSMAHFIEDVAALRGLEAERRGKG